MKIDLVRIGNSQGIRIPKPIVEQCGFRGSVEITVKDKMLLVVPSRRVRDGWEEQFEAMAQRGDDALVDLGGPPSDWDETEWRW